MALALMSIGEKRTVQSLRGKDETLRHLQDLGFAPGAEVEMCRRDTWWNDSDR